MQEDDFSTFEEPVSKPMLSSAEGVVDTTGYNSGNREEPSDSGRDISTWEELSQTRPYAEKNRSAS